MKIIKLGNDHLLHEQLSKPVVKEPAAKTEHETKQESERYDNNQIAGAEVTEPAELAEQADTQPQEEELQPEEPVHPGASGQEALHEKKKKRGRYQA